MDGARHANHARDRAVMDLVAPRRHVDGFPHLFPGFQTPARTGLVAEEFQ